MVSIAFVVVAVLYTTQGSSVCSDSISDNIQVKKLVHVDFMNYDKSVNTDGDITDKQEVGKDEDQHIVYCNCRKEAIFMLFDCLVLL